MEGSAVPPPHADLENFSPAHALVHRHFLSCIAELRPNFVQIPREAARSLLGTRLDYFGDGNTTEPYASERVFFPEGQQALVPVSQALGETTRKLLTPEGILADAYVIEWRQAYEREGQYEDVILGADPLVRRLFLARLFRCGILGFSSNARSRITAFFVIT